MTSHEPLDVEAAEQRLHDLDQSIAATKHQIRKDLGDDPDEQHYEDSGSQPGDDQTIAP